MKRGILLIADGAGLSAETTGNAVTSATMPGLFGLMDKYGYATLAASGQAVGLEDGMVGNSEVGHTIIGAGFVPTSSLHRISEGFEEGSWEAHLNWDALAHHARIHVIGLLSDAGVHAHYRTISQAYEVASRRCPASHIVLHLVLDGVDSEKGSAEGLLTQLRLHESTSVGLIMGRKWFCDRSGDLSSTKTFVEALMGRTPALPFTYEALRAHVVHASESSFPAHTWGGPMVNRGEPVLITSHRADRARQSAIGLSAECPVYPMVELGWPVADSRAFFPSKPLQFGLGSVFEHAGIANTRIAECSKYPHVTRFFNGLHPARDSERGICIPSVNDDELPGTPEMSVGAVLDAVREVVSSSNGPHALIVNVANLDQVGHLGRYDLACAAARHVDQAITEIFRLCQQHGWELLITADHGNADKMIGSFGEPFNAHSAAPVPLVVIPSDGSHPLWISKSGTLAAVAPTFLAAIGLEPSEQMERSLIQACAATATSSALDGRLSCQ